MSQFWFTRRDEGLKEGEPSTWYLGDASDAVHFDVQVRKVREPSEIVIEWPGPDGYTTEVTWTFEDAGNGTTIARVVESGFAGNPQAITARALDSTGGFNQVLIAAKAFVEHGVALNVVADHA
jgi:uncharacterized protein YndB with AHSA1/START domain